MKIYIHIFTLGIQYDFVNKHLLYYFDFAKLIKKKCSFIWLHYWRLDSSIQCCKKCLISRNCMTIGQTRSWINLEKHANLFKAWEANKLYYSKQYELSLLGASSTNMDTKERKFVGKFLEPLFITNVLYRVLMDMYVFNYYMSNSFLH